MVEAATAKLKKLIDQLSKLRGRHTELVTVFVPTGCSLIDVINQIRNERGTAENIKSKGTRKNVVDALTKIEQHLKIYKSTPPHGVAVFCGNVSETEGTTDMRLWAIEPPEPLKVKMYWCDQRFELGPLMDMTKEKEVYGLVVMDTQEATIGVLHGKAIQVLRHLESIVPGKTAKGGQCVLAETRIMTPKGPVAVALLKPGDTIKAVNWERCSMVDVQIADIKVRMSPKAWRITTVDPRREIVATGEHKFFIKHVMIKGECIKEKNVDELECTDSLIVLSGGQIKEAHVESKYEIDTPKLKFYDIEVPKLNNFVANDMVVHNSSVRFARVREGLINDFYKKIAEEMRSVLPAENKGIIMGGPGPSKEDFMRGDYLMTDIRNKILGIQSVSYTDEAGLHELVERSKEMLAEASVTREKALMQKFFTELQKNSGLVTYGIQQVLRALEAGAVEVLLLSEGLDWSALELQCGCGWSGKMYVPATDVGKQACPKCGRIAGLIGQTDIIDGLSELSKNYGSTVEVISKDTREGSQLAALGGVAAILRYKYEK